MWSRDFLRVLHGAGKVAEQVAKSTVPEVSEQSAQLAKHVNELSRLMPYLMESVRPPNATVHAPSPQADPATSVDTMDVPVSEEKFKVEHQHEHPVAHAPSATQTTQHPLVHDQVAKDLGKTHKPVWNSPFAELDAEQKKDKTPSHQHSTDFQTVQSVLNEEKPKIASASDETPTKTASASDETQNTSNSTKQAPQSPAQEAGSTATPTPQAWTERHVPSSPLSRIIGFGSLAARLAVGTATEIVRSGGKGGARQALISDSNVERLAETLCTMRGAALKLGQMLSIQDENLVPPKLAEALDRVRQNAHVMPKDQLHAQLASELGEDWRDNFLEFDDIPIAAASIGQVHRATLKSGDRVAIKIQYPGVAESIESDLMNLKRIVTYTNVLPKGLYIDEIIRVGQEELTAECDYAQEADNQERFRQFVHENGMDDRFVVPRVHRELSSSRILTTELISGVPIDKAVHLPQHVRDSIGRRILELTVRELFQWRFMQTDPNWSNFMYNSATDKVGLVDFGAAREYPKEFVNQYFNIVWAAANEDEDTMLDYSIRLKFLTGDESPAMLRAHVAAGMVVGEPFRSHEPFDFYGSQLTKRLGEHTQTFMHSRLTPPPQEVYSLHRKLAGAFLMCIKLRAKISCRDVLEEAHAKYAPKN
ncbi:hypothetical protein Poli38472_005624 [Pythium oligandrum]|uniref:ABC1 atypical kinase-like domain-containing protein n=1 Tax=Pythium oligandrum TaxID=41045 RepID=A0A8K1CGC3_PYTOL|nr:hypothetical protein Poli38472_005624 [Pythium oligandrum]|eukprot:TMW63006.1 hypothetical protein Poli38472_005624 [Pythium oligandrum]